MNRKFDQLYNLLMEEIQDDHNFEFENMTLAIVPGSFKPPHKGHWEMIMNYANKVDKVIVLISNISTKAISSRPLSLPKLREFEKIKEYVNAKYSSNNKLLNKLNVDIENLPYTKLKEILTSILNMNIEDNKLNQLITRYLDKLNNGLFTSIRKTINNTEITPEMSKEIFEIFAKVYDVQNKVDVRISEFASPILATYNLIINNCKNCKIILGVSTKGGDDSRWNDFKQSEDNPTNTIIQLPMTVQTMLSATQLRNNINDLQKDWFPEKLTNFDLEQIKNILNLN